MKSERSALFAFLALVLFLGAIILLPSMLYVVEQREMAVVLQFGKPVAERMEPGLYSKLPFVQEVRKLPNTRQFWGDTGTQALSDLPTKDDKKIEVVPWALWRVSEPTVFVQRLVTMEEGERRVSEFVRGAIRDVVTQYELVELVRSTDRELHAFSGARGELVPITEVQELLPDAPPEIQDVRPNLTQVKTDIEFGRLQILDRIKREARNRLTSGGEEGGRGIELIDVGISRIDFVPSVQAKTFDRWIAERNSIAALNVNVGEKLKQQIIAQAEREVERIVGEGQKKSNEIRGTVDAEVIRKYADAISQAGEFYTFVRTLEAYRKSVGRDTRLILTTDSEFLRLLKQLDPAQQNGPVTGSE